MLTAAGMDGYLAYRVQGYYILGEWFLGAIILLYLLYPVVAAGFNKSVIASSAIVLAGYIFACAATLFVIPLEENLFACLASFFIGMLIAKYKKQILDNKWLVIPCAAICAILFFVRIPAGSIEMSRINNSICIHIMGPSLFICLYHAGCLINKCKAAGSVISFMGKLSYPVFVKPSKAGSSKGVSKAHDRDELIEGLKLAAKHDTKILVERNVIGREIECAVLGTAINPDASGVGEILSAAEFYDFDAKYSNADSKTVISP